MSPAGVFHRPSHGPQLRDHHTRGALPLHTNLSERWPKGVLGGEMLQEGGRRPKRPTGCTMSSHIERESAATAWGLPLDWTCPLPDGLFPKGTSKVNSRRLERSGCQRGRKHLRLWWESITIVPQSEVPSSPEAISENTLDHHLCVPTWLLPKRGCHATKKAEGASPATHHDPNPEREDSTVQ